MSNVVSLCALRFVMQSTLQEIKIYKLHHVLLTRYRRYMDGFLNDIFCCSSAYVLAVAHTARSCVSPEYAGVKTMNMRVRIGTSFVCVPFMLL